MQGNKRTAIVAALIFLQKNSYIVQELHSEEIADILLKFLNHDENTDREDLVNYFAERAYSTIE